MTKAKQLAFRGLMGAVALACAPGLALAAPKATAPKATAGASGGSPTVGAAAGAEATTPPGNAPANAATPAPLDSAAPAAPPAGDEAPPTPDAAPEPPAVSPPPAAEQEEAPPPRKVRRPRRRYVEEDDEDSVPETRVRPPRREERETPEAASPAAWSVDQTGFILSAERLSSLAAWSQTTTFATGSGLNQSSEDVTVSGTDVSLLAGQGSNIYAIPRVGFDGRFSNGVTLGGAISYIVQSSKQEGSGTGPSYDNPTITTFVFAPRMGVLFEASPNVSVWLRGGVTRISVSSAGDDRTAVVNEATVNVSNNVTTTALAVTLDPQLVFTPIPHVGVTLGATFDIGASGSIVTGSNGDSTDFKASSYGVTAGLAALF